jgi:acyl-CoA thioesterase-1
MVGLLRIQSRWIWLILLVVCGWSAGCGGRHSDDRVATSAGSASGIDRDRPDEVRRPKIVVLGDSLTAGLGLLETQAFPAWIQKRIAAEGYNFEVDNAGVSGDTSAGGLRRLDWALDGDVRVMIVALGGNDGLRGLSVGELKENLLQIIERARNRHIAVILAGMEAPPNYGQEYAKAFRQAYRDVALQQRVLFIPFLLDGVAGHPELNQPDGIHPNAQGAERVADTVWTVLKPLLDQLAAAS